MIGVRVTLPRFKRGPSLANVTPAEILLADGQPQLGSAGLARQPAGLKLGVGGQLAQRHPGLLGG